VEISRNNLIFTPLIKTFPVSMQLENFVIWFTKTVQWTPPWAGLILPISHSFINKYRYIFPKLSLQPRFHNQNIFLRYVQCLPITVAARSKAWTAFALSNAGIVGSNPIRGKDVCIECFYSVFVFFCVYVAALRRADPPSKESYRLCIGSRK
jgi:hypothetical protein